MDRLADHCTLITKGTTPTTLGFDFAESGIPFLRVQNIEKGSVDYKDGTLFINERTHQALARSEVKPGDILVSIAGTIGRAAVVPDSAPRLNCNQAVAIIRTDATIYRPFLRYWLESRDAQRQMRCAAVTGTISNLSLSQLRNLVLAMPVLSEQRRIADILDKADALRAKRRAALAQLDKLARSIFLDMFGDPARNPTEWPVVDVGEICHVKGGKRLPNGEEYSSSPTPFRYIRVTDFKSGQVDESALVYLKPETQKRIARYVVNTGDIVLSIAGSIGLVAEITERLDGVNLTENAAKLVPKQANIYDPAFLTAYLRSDFARSQIGSQIGQVTIGKLALFRIEKIKVTLPPLTLQREFKTRLSSVKGSQDVQEKSLIIFDSLFRSLQNSAFRGNLTLSAAGRAA